jgi:hypothetical protein
MPAPEAAPSSDSLSAAQTAPAEPTIKPAVKRASSAAAMKGRAEIAGSVADPSGAAIPGAQVTVRGASSGDARTAVTNPQGRFDFASLPSGDYQVEVQASGFNMFSRAVTVQPSERASLNAKLDVGSASETVSVAAASGPTVMALDSDGNVFLSSDQGEHWNQVKVQWLGKAVGLKIAPPVQAGMLMAQPNGALAARSSHGTVAGAEAPVPAPSGAPFELTNDKGQVWVSSDDGKTWTAK